MRSLGGGAPEVVGESRGHSSWTTLWWVKGGSETEIVHKKGEVCTKGGLFRFFFYQEFWGKGVVLDWVGLVWLGYEGGVLLDMWTDKGLSGREKGWGS